MHAEATKHVLLGRKSLGCPAAISRSGRNDRGGEQTWGPEHKEMAAVSKKRSVMKSFRREQCGKPTLIVNRGRPMTWRKKQARALRGTAVTGAQAPREGFAEITSGSRSGKLGRGGTDGELAKPLIVIQRVQIPPDQSRADGSVVSLAIHRATGGCRSVGNKEARP